MYQSKADPSLLSLNGNPSPAWPLPIVRETSESLFEESSRSLRLLAVGKGAAGRVCGLALREDWFEG